MVRLIRAGMIAGMVVLSGLGLSGTGLSGGSAFAQEPASPSNSVSGDHSILVGVDIPVVWTFKEQGGEFDRVEGLRLLVGAPFSALGWEEKGGGQHLGGGIERYTFQSKTGYSPTTFLLYDIFYAFMGDTFSAAFGLGTGLSSTGDIDNKSFKTQLKSGVLTSYSLSLGYVFGDGLDLHLTLENVKGESDIYQNGTPIGQKIVWDSSVKMLGVNILF
ncbi:MAG: hypothetical protein OEW12_02750 [Deltaproteobacteria bacterium]|nr:hypothetical protein [Deltaproteobacteria bacterium]